MSSRRLPVFQMTLNQCSIWWDRNARVQIVAALGYREKLGLFITRFALWMGLVAYQLQGGVSSFAIVWNDYEVSRKTPLWRTVRDDRNCWTCSERPRWHETYLSRCGWSQPDAGFYGSRSKWNLIQTRKLTLRSKLVWNVWESNIL